VFFKNYNLIERVINRESKIIAISLRRIGDFLAIAVNVARSIHGNLLPFVIARLPERKPWQSPFCFITSLLAITISRTVLARLLEKARAI
jgi:hypothetical protein